MDFNPSNVIHSGKVFKIPTQTATISLWTETIRWRVGIYCIRSFIFNRWWNRIHHLQTTNVGIPIYQQYMILDLQRRNLRQWLEFQFYEKDSSIFCLPLEHLKTRILDSNSSFLQSNIYRELFDIIKSHISIKDKCLQTVIRTYQAKWTKKKSFRN